MTLVERIRRFRNRLVDRAMRSTNGDRKAASGRLGCSPTHVSVLLVRMGKKAKDYKVT